MATTKTTEKLDAKAWALKLNKDYKAKTLVQFADVAPAYTRVSTGALGFDYPLYGGFVLGRIAVFTGKEHSGKTTAATLALAAYQREFPDRTCLYVDVEQAMDWQFQAIANGIDLSKVAILNSVTDNGDIMSDKQLLATILDFEQNVENPGLIVLDSVPALISAADLGDDFEADKGMRASSAASLQKFLKEIQPLLFRYQNTMIVINQLRVSGKTFTGAPIYSEPGGAYLKYASTISIRFGTRTFTKGDDMDSGNDGEGSDGFRIKFKITKNKTAACNRGGGFITYRYLTGRDDLTDLFDIGCQFNFIKAESKVTYVLTNLTTGEIYEDPKSLEQIARGEKPDWKDGILRGYKKDLKEYLRQHPDFMKEFYDMLKQHINASNTLTSLLTAEETAEIDAEEKASEKAIAEEKKNLEKQGLEVSAASVGA